MTSMELIQHHEHSISEFGWYDNSNTQSETTTLDAQVLPFILVA